MFLTEWNKVQLWTFSFSLIQPKQTIQAKAGPITACFVWFFDTGSHCEDQAGLTLRILLPASCLPVLSLHYYFTFFQCFLSLGMNTHLFTFQVGLLETRSLGIEGQNFSVSHEPVSAGDGRILKCCLQSLGFPWLLAADSQVCTRQRDLLLLFEYRDLTQTGRWVKKMAHLFHHSKLWVVKPDG